MAFYWYLDIHELPLDNNFTVGPITFQPNEEVSLPQFVERINNAFLAAYEDDLTSNYYSIAARIAPISPTSDTPGSSTGPTSYTLSYESEFTVAQNNKNFLIEYRIATLGAQNFRIRFRTGEHGSTSVAAAGGTESGQHGGAPPRGQITVTNFSSAQMFVLPYCQIPVTVTDKPPVPPDVAFVPYIGKNNRLLILLAPNTGEREEKPIVLRDTDASFIAEEYMSQKNLEMTVSLLASTPIKLTYKSDDPVRTYEVYRIDRRPESYSDFLNERLAVVQEQLAQGKFSTGVSYLDTIKPNKKYYYCFRSRDRHTNISNPTHIFEVELVDSDGRLFLKKKTIEFDPIQEEITRNARRFLCIEPARNQLLVAPGGLDSLALASADVPPPSGIIGVADDSVWDKKFKIRLTSKKTGKKIDLNVTFKNTGITNP